MLAGRSANGSPKMTRLPVQCLYLHQFASLGETRHVIGDFIRRYNTEWFIAQLGYRTSAEARATAVAEVA